MKKLMLCHIFLSLTMIGLVPLNMFFLWFPEWVVLIPIITALVMNILIYMKSKKKKAAIILFLFSIAAGCFSLFGSFCNPYWNSMLMRSYQNSSGYNQPLTYEQAQDDLNQVMYYLEKCHPMLLNGVSAEIQKKYNSASKQLQEDGNITTVELNREIQGILSSLSDGHTSSYGNYENPRYLKYIAERNAGSWSLQKINGKTLEALYDENKHLFSYESDAWGMACLKSKITSVEGLSFLGIEADGVTFTWENEVTGNIETCTYISDDFITYEEYREYNAGIISDESTDFVSYSIDKNKNLAVLTLKKCNYNDTYVSCLSAMFSEIKASNIQNIAVDLRGNGGGSSQVANEFIRYLDIDEYKTDTFDWRFGFFSIASSRNNITNKKYDQLTFIGNVYILTDTGTFSSAMLFSEYIKDNAIGTLIGEPPANAPNGFGEVTTFRLQHSGLYFQVSTKHFKRADANCTDFLVIPDIECESDEVFDKLDQLLLP